MLNEQLPLSITQQGMYFDCHVREASDYHVVLHLRVEPLDPNSLHSALARVMDEQPALRSSIVNDKDGLYYQLSDDVAVPLTTVDFRGREHEVESAVGEATETAFDLQAAPLFRVVHGRLTDEDRLIVVCHHLIADGMSASVLAERIMSLARADGPDPDPSIEVDPGFALYQEQFHAQRLDGEVTDQEAEYRTFWRENLERQQAADLSHWMPPQPIDAPGREIRIPLSAELNTSVRTASQQARISEFTLYLGAFGLLLARYADVDHLSVATPFTDRPEIEMEQSVGCFIKTLPVHVDADPQLTVRTMLEHVRNEILSTWSHLEYPVADLLGEYPALGRVFDITFIKDRYPAYPDGVLGAVRNDRVMFPGLLTVLIEQIGNEAELVFQFKETSLSEDKVRRLAQRYVHLLERIPEHLDSPVSALPSISAEETTGLVDRLSQTHYFDWEPSDLGSVFLGKVTANPDRIAWSDSSRTYTNAWVHDAAAIVQHHIIEAIGTIQTDSIRQPVAVLLPRGSELLAGLFGTILAGCHYVPLADNLPAERLSQIFEDASVSLVLTMSDIEIDLPEGAVRLDIDLWDDFASLRSDERTEIREQMAPVEVGPDDILYIEYTSGSTGVPKGVVITHANIKNTALDLEHRFPLTIDDVFLLKTAFTFDIFGTEIYGWLMGEGRLHILPVGQEADPSALLATIRQHNITHVNFTPTLLRLLLDVADSTGRATDLSGVRYLFSGGEALTSDIVDRFFRLSLNCTLENVYGPTEATMWATHSTITATDRDAVAPIGVPLNDYRVYVIDRNGELCGVDMPGEVCIAGAGVAVGYLNRDELNATQFVANPFFDPESDPAHMGRMYRTGDLGLLRDDGRFAFIRRIDRQVKVGGIRMELGEIEQALLRTDGVVEAAVLVDDTVPPRLVGFFTGRAGVSVADVRTAIGQRLQPQMVPSLLAKIEEMPRSTAGKLDRRALMAQLAASGATAETEPSDLPAQQRILRRWKAVLGDIDINPEASFFEQGGNSLSLMRLQLELLEEFGREIPITELLKRPTVHDQSDLFEEKPAPISAPPVARSETATHQDIAIIGIGVEVPGAIDVQGFWLNLQQGRESITFYEDDELRALGVSESDIRDPNYVKARGRVTETDRFDEVLFKISPAEVASTSPQLRLLYRCFWHACEDAGYDPRSLPGRVGVFAGGNDDFAWYQKALLEAPSFGHAYENFTLATNHFLSTRLSYFFDLRGPSLSALTGCSTSLLTVHLAAQSLRAGECDMAVAGGVSIELPDQGGYHYVDGMMLSPDGHCRPFDAGARGTVFSSGGSLLLLKPIDAALRDHDPVYAVIKGSAVGNDGGRKLSYTAPSEDGQYETTLAAYEASGVDPATVSFVEAHGTGTFLGDPIEVASLTRVFSQRRTGSCVLSSVKGNVGHTDSAAGAVGLSKVALSLKHRFLPGTCNYNEPNPTIDLTSTPFTVSSQGQAWPGENRRAGINSFGVGGTNVHMIVEEAPVTEATTDRPFELLQFSAATGSALGNTAERVVRQLADDDEMSAADAAYTLRHGRAELPVRKSMVVASDEPREADYWVQRLTATAAVEAIPGRPVAWLFSGQGNQYHMMGLNLYQSTSSTGVLFRHWMDELIGLLPSDEADTFRTIIHGPDDARLHHTEWSQYALFSTQFALAKVLQSYGVTPAVMLGHSVGELTAATLAGVWSLEDAARLVRERGKLMQGQEPGVMVAAAASAERVRPLVEAIDDVWVSLDNSTQRSVLGMKPNAVDQVVQRLKEQGIRSSTLKTSHAFHTPMMADAAEAFVAAVEQVEMADPSIPIISNRSGQLVGDGEMREAEYWGHHITDVVQFAGSIRTMLAQGPMLGIEMGPGRSLMTFVADDPTIQPDQTFVDLLRGPREPLADEAYLLTALGRLWSAGLELDWSSHSAGRRISLPGYVFDRNLFPYGIGVADESEPTQQPSMLAIGAGDTLEMVRDSFRQVLGYGEMGPDDDFFAFGGDSLKATSLAAHLKGHYGIEVAVADIFAASTPATLAGCVQLTDSADAMAKAPAADSYPLSPAQSRMYIAARMDAKQLIYNMPSVTRLSGSLDPHQVRTALQRLVERHEPLRTVFTVSQGEVRQVILDTGQLPELPLRFSDGRHNLDESIDGILTRFVRPFDLERGPLFRMEIVNRGADGSLLLFDIHHIIADAISVEVLTRDFSELYVRELEPLPLQYTDFVMHGENNEQARESMEQVVASLADAPTLDLLPPDHAREQSTTAAGRVILRFDRDRVDQIKALAAAHNATPFMVMLSAWGAVFARYAEADDLVIGAPVTGRTLAETQEMVGMFVNMMPIRLRPDPTASFSDYLSASRQSVLEALAHQKVPFDQLVEKLNLRRVVGRHPLFDISFDYHNIEHHELQVDAVTAQPVEIEPLAVGMDLVITCAEADDLTVHIDYAADLFNRSTIENLAEHFDVFLDRACADDSLEVAAVPLYSDARHEAIRSRLSGEPFSPIHEVIAQRAAETPDATAVVDADGQHRSYRWLDRAANVAAAALVDGGLQPGDPVALFAVRTANLLVAQLAILKAGGLYVPLDPAHPRDRHERILADIEPRFAFAPPDLAVTEQVATVFDIETCGDVPTPSNGTDGPAPPTDVVVDPDDPIYAVYTSGSTGVPKGIKVRHRGVFNLYCDHRERRIFGPGDVVISLADPTFDIFTFESLLPLASGACVHMCPGDDQKDATAIAARVESHAVTHIQVPVSKMVALCDNRRFRALLDRFRVVVCGGEHFSENLLDLLQAESNARIFNMYGPSETTVTTTVKEFAPGDDVTIGSAISGSAVLIVNQHGMIQPHGVAGELCVAGQGLAIGYTSGSGPDAHRAFTEIRELPDLPIYRTGDVGIARADGEIMLKGRLDHQVKLNGNRIELGEIEKTAMGAAGVSYAVAAVEDDNLVLYYTCETADCAPSIKSEITQALPKYMMPQFFRQVAEMPKLANNKIDRKALGRTHGEPTGAEVGAAAGPPSRTTSGGRATVDIIVGIWEEVLGQPVRPSDNFFDAGGNSYKLMLVGNRVNEALDMEVPLVRLFENPTPQSLADTIGPVTAPTGVAAESAAATGSETIALDDLAGFETWADEYRPTDERKIAVIGVAGVFPGADTVDQFWDNRMSGTVSISRFTREELLDAGIDESMVDDPRYVNARGFVDADTFDADFFQYSAREAETMDPQMRLLHQTAWHALEDGGYVPADFRGDIALFVGSGTNFPWMAGLLGQRRTDHMAAYEAMTANEKDFLATKIAYKLDLTGPAVNVQTACSTSLVAIHEAVQCLRQGEADMALAGGVALNFPRKEGYIWQEGMIFSRDGVCRPFSQEGEGTVAGQGAGVVLLKPLDRAVEDGDHIYAVIAGSAVNNDGRNKVGYTAPSVSGQQRVIQAALTDAQVPAEDVGYVETHGTGTKLGDPIEYTALAAVYGGKQRCALGATKANIGHLDAAAGVAGFLTAVGVLHRGEVPPMANFSTLNENIDQSSSLHVPTTKLVPDGGVGRAAVSSFGIGGTNAHVILEDPPARPEEAGLADDGLSEYLLPVSALTDESLRRMQESLARFCQGPHPLRDVSHTLGAGRAEFGSRAVAIAGPGRPLTWIEPSDPPLAVDASDAVRLALSTDVMKSTDAMNLGNSRSDGVGEAIERELVMFDNDLRSAVRQTLFAGSGGGVSGRSPAPPAAAAIDRIAEFVKRVALIRVLGSEGLHAPANADRLLRIAGAFAAGQIGPSEAINSLKSGTVPAGPTVTGGIEPVVVNGQLDRQGLGRLLASQWVQGRAVERSRFCARGCRIPMPGYAFEPRRFNSDIKLNELLVGAERPAPQAANVDDALRDGWKEVLGTEPGENDDFLLQGGDSLSAVHLAAIIEDRTGLSVDAGDILTDARFSAIRDLVQTRSGPAASAPPAPSVPLRDPSQSSFPTSPAQQRLYAVCALQDDTTAYNLGIAYRVSGRLDVDQLRAVLGQVVAQHDQLRTSFHLDGGSLVQRISAEVADVVSVTEVSAEQAAARLARGAQPFDLATAPLLRVEVLSVDDELHYLLIDMHHIIADQHSLAILGDDIAAALQGRPLTNPTMRYVDYVDELARWEETGRLEADVEHFRRLISEDIPRLELPVDKNPPEEATFDGARHNLVCSTDKAAVAGLAQQCGATPYMVFLTAVTRLLGLYSGQSEFLLGTAVAGRSMPGTDHTVGMFVNTLPMRVSDDSGRTVGEAVASARQSALAVLSHQNAPFDGLLSQLGHQSDGDTHPLFDVLINYVNVGTEELELEGVRLELLPPGAVKSRYALSISIAERAHDFTVDFEYRTELFEESTIARFSRHLDRLIGEMTGEPDRPMVDVEIEAPEDRDSRRAALTADGPVIDQSLLERVQAAFVAHQDVPALRWEDHEWSYRRLDEVTDVLAGGLQRAGVGPGDLVLCLLDRDPWQVFSRVALMKCGAVEVPLDAASPPDRIAQTLADAGAKLALCSDPRIVAGHDVVGHRPQDLTGSYEGPADVTAASPLIMIYTSGTTGQPKGTLVTHGGVLSTCFDNGYMDYQPGDRILHLTGYTFDPSLLDIYSAFLHGATLVMGKHDHNMDARLLADFLRTESIDAGILITAVFHLLMAEDPSAVANMSALYVGGEAMQPWAAGRAFEVLGGGKLYNLYGPTEASICTTYFRVDSEPDFLRMPIGHPAKNRELFIVHPDGTDVPQGVPGELCVGGPSVAVGYHRRPELTAAKFPDSLGRISQRLYRTGDRVVLDERDRIVFLDRIDRQIKHAGYRIELGEIEVAMQRCTGVSDAVVIHSTTDNVSRLTGFYTGDSAPTEPDLRQLLLAKLPRYMVPQRMIRMAEFPLTSHGKVDRKQLAADIDRVEEPARPSTGGHDPAVLAKLREVLGLPDLGPSDDFFDAGAQSIQAIAVVRSLRESGADIQVSDLYRNPTAEKLSAILNRGPEAASSAPSDAPRRPLSPDRLEQLAGWAVSDGRRLAEAFAFEDPIYDFRVGAAVRLHRSSGADSGAFMHRITGHQLEDVTEAVATLAGRHEALRARFDEDSFEILEPELFAGLSALVPVQDLRRVAETQADAFAGNLAHALQREPFAKGLLWRCVVIHEADQRVRLVWAFHHGIFDGFSAGVLDAEIRSILKGDELLDAQPYSRFLSTVTANIDWPAELESFDYTTWLSSNRPTTAALQSNDNRGRLSRSLDGENPLDAALTAAHGLLSELTGSRQVAVGFVANCRRWMGDEFSNCLGEFLDVIPVLLQGDGDQATVAQRTARAQNEGLHYLHSLFEWTGDDPVVSELRSVYWNDPGSLDLTLLNFQGYIAPGDLPEDSADGPTLAVAHVNVWYDDDHLHLEVINGPTPGR